MPNTWVLNASPLIALAKIGHIHLIKELCAEPVIPYGVVQEIFQGPEQDQAKQWLRTHGKAWIRRGGEVNPHIIAWDLGQGESEVLNWAYTYPKYTAILDDRAARSCARALKLKVSGTIGIILLAKRARKITLISPLLRQLEEAGFRIDGPLLRKAKELAEEA